MTCWGCIALGMSVLVVIVLACIVGIVSTRRRKDGQ